MQQGPPLHSHIGAGTGTILAAVCAALQPVEHVVQAAGRIRVLLQHVLQALRVIYTDGLEQDAALRKEGLKLLVASSYSNVP